MQGVPSSVKHNKSQISVMYVSTEQEFNAHGFALGSFRAQNRYSAWKQTKVNKDHTWFIKKSDLSKPALLRIKDRPFVDLHLGCIEVIKQCLLGLHPSHCHRLLSCSRLVKENFTCWNCRYPVCFQTGLIALLSPGWAWSGQWYSRGNPTEEIGRPFRHFLLF